MSQAAATKDDGESKTIVNTRLLMSASAVFVGLLGAMTTFFPQEVLGYYGVQPEQITVMFVKTTGALYLGFAILNWMARGNIIGGIYSRPVALGNFFHFAVVGIMFIKQLVSSAFTIDVLVGTTGYAVFAIGFGYIIFKGGQSCS